MNIERMDVPMGSDGMIMAMWDETDHNGSPVTGYEVQYKMSDEADSKYNAGDRRRSRLRRGREIPTLPQRLSSMTDTETTFIGGCVMM